MKNKFTDLQDHLMATLERVSDEDVKGDELEAELKRAKVVSEVAGKMIDNGRLVLDAERLKFNAGVPGAGSAIADMIGNVRGGTAKRIAANGKAAQ